MEPQKPTPSAMTKEQVLEQFGDVVMKFTSYYKYTFSFEAEQDGLVFLGWFGGDADDIYRYEITVDSVMLVKDFEDQLHRLYIGKGEDRLFEYPDF